MKDNKYLKKASHLNLLYIESKDDFRLETSKILKEFFKNTHVANNEKDAISLLKEYHTQIVIMDIDIHVYYFDWLKIAIHIREINPEAKIIVLSGEDKKKLLLDAIDVGVTKFLIKPIKHKKFSEAIKLAISQLDYENNKKIFSTYLHSIFNYRKTMVIMTKDNNPILANYIFLDFFDVESIHEFNKLYKDIGDLFLRYDDYLYNEGTKNWLNDVNKDIKKQYHVHIKNKDGETRHFILKYHLIPQKKSYALLSFDDISVLDSTKDDNTKVDQSRPTKKDKKSIFKALQLIKKDEIKVQLYNYYKGLTIVHDALITDIKDESIILKTDYLQQKAIKVEGKTLISSEILPFTIACDKVSKISFEKQRVKLQDIHYSSTSPATRKTIRLLPDSKYTVTLFIHKKRVKTDIEISDLSFDSVRLTFKNVPPDLNIYDKVIINLILTYENKPLIVNTGATVVKEAKELHNDSVTFVFNLDEKKKEIMLKYMTARQIEIIKEFKALKIK